MASLLLPTELLVLVKSIKKTNLNIKFGFILLIFTEVGALAQGSWVSRSEPHPPRVDST